MSDTYKVSFTVTRDIFSALRQDPEHFVPELRLAAAVKWYELGMISQAKAAEIAGITRSEFITELARFKVTPFQYVPINSFAGCKFRCTIIVVVS
jgi:predicted HTH domain antitoxin